METITNLMSWCPIEFRNGLNEAFYLLLFLDTYSLMLFVNCLFFFVTNGGYERL